MEYTKRFLKIKGNQRKRGRGNRKSSHKSKSNSNIYTKQIGIQAVKVKQSQILVGIIRNKKINDIGKMTNADALLPIQLLKYLIA